MGRTGRVVLIFIIIIGSMIGMCFFRSWQAAREDSDQETLYNVYITSVTGTTVCVVSDEGDTRWELRSSISEDVTAGVADIMLTDGIVTKIRRKPDTIEGKLLKIEKDRLTLEHYGSLELSSDACAYHLDGDKAERGDLDDLIVGSVDAEYVVAGGKICAVLVRESVVSDIRVLLSDSDYSTYDFESVTVTATSDYIVTCGDKTTQHSAGETNTWKVKDVDDYIVVDTKGAGKICIRDIKRQYGVAEYRGILEVHREDKSLHLINELPIEQYLYSVVPSEMPTEYQRAALQAQAVCARTYAVNQMQSDSLKTYGAHVDDSVSYQVYNNLREDETSIAAVDDTKDMVVTADKKVANIYFYSASCGVSAGVKDVWLAKKDLDYLPSTMLDADRTSVDFSKEDDFRDFLEKKQSTSDSDSPWYRWKTSTSAKELEQSIIDNAEKRYKVSPSQIRTRRSDGTYESTGDVDIGKLKNIEIEKRGKSGVVKCILIQGSKNTIKVYTEYNIRTLLSGKDVVFTRQDGSEVTGLSCLPSGYFYFEKKDSDYVFYGGGYGHGVGMSQNGADKLAKEGKSYEEILTFYFPGTSVRSRGSL